MAAKWKAYAKQYGIPISYGGSHIDGHWYDNPAGFPFGFMDSRGVLIVQDEHEWRELQDRGFFAVGEKVNVPKKPRGPGDISQIPGYTLFASYALRRRLE